MIAFLPLRAFSASPGVARRVSGASVASLTRAALRRDAALALSPCFPAFQHEEDERRDARGNGDVQGDA